jgi:hypothetical protein
MDKKVAQATTIRGIRVIRGQKNVAQATARLKTKPTPPDPLEGEPLTRRTNKSAPIRGICG